MASIPVYQGYWVDYSQGPVIDGTFTLNVRYAGYVIGILSTFVALVGSSLWELIALWIHQWRTTDGCHDGLYFQQQVAYRNPSSPAGTAFDLIFGLCWAWRKKNTGGKRVERLRTRSIWGAIPPLVVAIGFAAAGTFVSYVAAPTYKSSNVLAAAGRCGYPSINSSSVAGQGAAQLKVNRDTQNGRNYARACYGSQQGGSQCALYPVQTLGYNHTVVDCPFGTDPEGNGLCNFGNNQAVSFFTNHLDSNDDFGINAPSQNRVKLQYNVTCAPIHYQNYQKIVQLTPTSGSTSASGSLSKETYYQYYFGAVEDVSEYTYSYDIHSRTDIIGYQIVSVYYIPGYDNGWMPVDSLALTDADVSLHFFATNSVQYLDPVQDPWFLALNQVNDSSPGITINPYEADNFVNPMACTDQYQICNPNTTPWTCTAVAGQSGVKNAIFGIGLNNDQLAAAERVVLNIQRATTYTTVSSLGPAALLATTQLLGPVFGIGLPDNQWQLEVQGWFETSLAKLQYFAVEFVSNLEDLGPYGSVFLSSKQGGVDTALRNQCGQQRIRNIGGFQSFSLLGVLIVVIVGAIIILTSWIFEPCCLVPWRKRRQDVSAREVARVADKKYQLQRMAFVGSGWADWQDGMDSSPVTLGELQTLSRTIVRLPVAESHPHHENNDEVSPRYPLKASTGIAVNGANNGAANGPAAVPDGGVAAPNENGNMAP